MNKKLNKDYLYLTASRLKNTACLGKEDPNMITRRLRFEAGILDTIRNKFRPPPQEAKEVEVPRPEEIMFNSEELLGEGLSFKKDRGAYRDAIFLKKQETGFELFHPKFGKVVGIYFIENAPNLTNEELEEGEVGAIITDISFNKFVKRADYTELIHKAFKITINKLRAADFNKIYIPSKEVGTNRLHFPPATSEAVFSHGIKGLGFTTTRVGKYKMSVKSI